MAFSGKTRQRLLLEIGVALFLSAIYFWFVKYYTVGIPNNTTNGEVFSSCSLSHFQLRQLYDVWKGRLSGLLLTGWLFDLLVNHTAGNYDQFCIVFGLYQSVWLFLLMLTMILALRHSLVINLGIFLGVMYNFFPVCGLYFYPWDIPATVFFMLAVLFFRHRKPDWMVAAICTGCFFKETVLVCALLVFFITEWKWWRRVIIFAAIAALYLLGKKFLLAHINVAAAALSMNDSKNLGDVVKTGVLLENFKTLFSAQGLYVIFANAGTMVAVMLFGWQRRFLPYMVLIVVFLAGQAMYGAFLEFRIFMQILPLSLMILTERFWPASKEKVTQKSAVSKKSRPIKAKGKPAPDQILHNPIRALSWLTALLIGLSTLIGAWQYVMIVEKKPPIVHGNSPVHGEVEFQHLVQVCAWFRNGELDLEKKLSNGSVKNEDYIQVNTAWDWFVRGRCDKENKIAVTYQELGQDAEAAEHFRATLALSRGATTNSITANNFAWLLATAANPTLRDGDEAVYLADFACQATHFENATMISTLGAAFAENGQFDDAIAAAKAAEDVATGKGQTVIAEKNKQLLELYRAGMAYHRDPQTSPPPLRRIN